MNEAGDTDGGGDAGMSSSDAFSQSSQQSIGENDNDVFARFGLDAQKFGFDKEESSDQSGEESQGSDENEEAGQDADEKSFLGLVNSLGLVHNENPFQVGSRDELKNLIQMGRDYTQKTQSLSEERKAFETEKSGAETELNGAIESFNTQVKEFDGKLQELEQWSFTLNNLRETAPDLHEEIQKHFADTQKMYSNPILDQKLKAFQDRLDQTEKSLQQRESKLIVDGFDTEYAKLAPLEQSMKELGIAINKDEVKKQWAATGMAPEQVVGMLYGTKVMQAQASKSKVEQTKAKVSAKPVGSAGSSRTGTKVKTIDPKLKGSAFASAVWDKYTN